MTYVKRHVRRRLLTKKQRLDGMEASLRSPRTPKHLKKGLRKYLRSEGRNV